MNQFNDLKVGFELRQKEIEDEVVATIGFG